MADTRKGLQIFPEQLYQLSAVVKMTDLSDAAFRTLICLYDQAWQADGNSTAALSLADLTKARGITELRLQEHLAELQGHKLIKIADPCYSAVDLDESLEEGKICVFLLALDWAKYEWPVEKNQYIQITISPSGIVEAQAKDKKTISGYDNIMKFLREED
ncbi:MAG: hypothetical protein L6R45_29580 [Anaerolineae bacterium]|nr:hypothetical protein [Anaerolineae bacterium]